MNVHVFDGAEILSLCSINKRDFSVKEMRTSVEIAWILPGTCMEYARRILFQPKRWACKGFLQLLFSYKNDIIVI